MQTQRSGPKCSDPPQKLQLLVEIIPLLAHHVKSECVEKLLCSGEVDLPPLLV